MHRLQSLLRGPPFFFASTIIFYFFILWIWKVGNSYLVFKFLPSLIPKLYIEPPILYVCFSRLNISSTCAEILVVGHSQPFYWFPPTCDFPAIRHSRLFFRFLPKCDFPAILRFELRDLYISHIIWIRPGLLCMYLKF